MPLCPPIPDNTPFSLEPIKRIARGDSSNVSTLHMSAHAGTHVDAPRHFSTTAGPRRCRSRCCRPARVIESRAQASRRTTAGSTCRRRPAADQDAQLAAVGLARVPHRLRRRHRVGAASGRSRHQGPRRRLPVGRAVQKPGAPAHHMLLGAGTIVIEGSTCATSTRHLRDVLPAAAVVGADGAPARVVLRRS